MLFVHLVLALVSLVFVLGLLVIFVVTAAALVPRRWGYPRPWVIRWYTWIYGVPPWFD